MFDNLCAISIFAGDVPSKLGLRIPEVCVAIGSTFGKSKLDVNRGLSIV